MSVDPVAPHLNTLPQPKAEESSSFDWTELENQAKPKMRNRWSVLLIRLVVGFVFLAHGYAKLARGPEHFISILHSLGVPAPGLMGWRTIGTELIGGEAVLAGAWVACASLALATILIVAAVTVHLPYGFSSIKLQAITSAGAQFGQPGHELDLLYLACLVFLAIGGSGPLAVDNLRHKIPAAQPDGKEV